MTPTPKQFVIVGYILMSVGLLLMGAATLDGAGGSIVLSLLGAFELALSVFCAAEAASKAGILR